MFGQFLNLAIFLIFSVGFSKSDETIFNTENDVKTIHTILKLGCSKGSTLDQKNHVDKCFKASNHEFYQSVLTSTQEGGNCVQYMEDKTHESKDMIPFCLNIISTTDANTQRLIRCAAETYGKYPDMSKANKEICNPV